MPFFGWLSSSPRMNGYNFTERVRQVLSAAREQSARLNHEYVGTEHMLLALVAEEGGVSAAVLSSLGVDPNSVRAMVEATVQRGRSPYVGSDLPYTSRAKKVLELSMAEARQFHHSYVGTEHLLLGLLAERTGIAAQVLVEHGLSLETARAETIRILGTMPERPAETPPAAPPARAVVPPSPADRAHEEIAWTRLRHALDVSQRLGAPPTVTLEEDGTLTVALGPDLVVTVDFPPSVGLRRRA